MTILDTNVPQVVKNVPLPFKVGNLNSNMASFKKALVNMVDTSIPMLWKGLN